MLGASLAYFGALVVVLGLYGLNCASLTARAAQIERTAARMRAQPGGQKDWIIGGPELAAVERVRSNPRQWRNRLARLATLLPANAALTSVAVNPDNLPSAEDQNKLVITGQVKVPPGQDRMRSVVQIVNLLHADPVFSAGYHNIQLASSRANAEGSLAEFVIECR
ncbi:MAG: hypothetical protein HYR74_08575 [Candidatus Eisenbacteria bacterium]|nr:hypothetical protein [Candidatus Eisenbacteria bacterium]